MKKIIMLLFLSLSAQANLEYGTYQSTNSALPNLELQAWGQNQVSAQGCLKAGNVCHRFTALMTADKPGVYEGYGTITKIGFYWKYSGQTLAKYNCKLPLHLHIEVNQEQKIFVSYTDPVLYDRSRCRHDFIDETLTTPFVLYVPPPPPEPFNYDDN